MNFAGALEKNAGKECTVRSLCREMKSSAGLRLDPTRRKGRLPKKGERLFAEKRRKAICRKKISWSGMCFYFLRRECYEELEQGRTLPCPQKS